MFAIGLILAAIGWAGVRITHNPFVLPSQQDGWFQLSGLVLFIGLVLMVVSLSMVTWRLLP